MLFMLLYERVVRANLAALQGVGYTAAMLTNNALMEAHLAQELKKRQRPGVSQQRIVAHNAV